MREPLGPNGPMLASLEASPACGAAGIELVTEIGRSKIV